MIRSVVRSLDVKLGFDPGNLLTMRLELPTSKYPENQQVTAFYRQLLERVKAVPGVQGAAVGNQPLPSEEKGNFSFEAECRTLEGGRDITDFNLISPDYFRTMNVPLLKGSYFDAADSERPPAAAIVNQTRGWILCTPL